MIDYEAFVRIKHCHEQQGLSPAQIAEALDLDDRTVRKWLAEKQYRPRTPAHRRSKLDPFKSYIVRLVETHPYTAVQVFQKIREEGFDGGYTIVKEYVQKIRPRRTPPFLKLSFAPGECAQVDWGSYGSVPVGSTSRRLSFFVMVMCHSRMMYVEFTVSQTMEHFLGCHQNAFERFGGIPEKIMVDNLKSAVLKRIVGRLPVFNPRYLDFAKHCGFTICPCGVGKGNEKGRVESGVGYVKKNFLAGLAVSDFSVLNPAAHRWLDTVANVRIHGETGKKPADLFAEERGCLTQLPLHPYDIAVVSPIRASSQFRVTLDTNRYSVPAEYAGARLTLKAYPDRLCIYDNDKLVARHVRSYDRRKDFEHPDHPKELLAQRKNARDQKIFMQFLQISPKAQAYYDQLAHRRMNPRHHIRKIVALSEIYGVEAVARAMTDAFALQAFSSEYIANLLEQRARKLPEPGALHLTRREDLLDITLEQPDINLYDRTLTRSETL
ncbi:IS21 family transposase [Desulfococcus multivorans]|uniref:Integrase catalytic region n=1 Tax=Desulfococcus multivorans DSM 2059 TaxID=1121405 RepID=S7T1P9_DESML|nr:IS21 family transposase [Desulfococcus multivorans]AOY57289.1 IstA1: transposase for insertion sequence element IS21 [Desulfococcus multivorans]AQU99740.1 transposase [Desulfococcus multivorans]EPR30486.1 Integrase catalytic region [Desulfococcus multivorans DSM 2059]SKA21537.1 Transposase [Desulfococcus multivorans DSM 2059]